MRYELPLIFDLLKSSLSISGTTQLHALLITGASLADPFLASTLLRSYATNDDILSARHLFDGIPQKSVLLWNSMIRAYAKRHSFAHAFFLFRRMQSSVVKPDNYTFACIIRACTDNNDPNGVKMSHSCVFHYGLPADPITSSALVSSYSRLGHECDARKVFDQMLQRDLVLWNVIIANCGYHGHCREGLELFRGLRCSGQKPDGYSLVGLISCFWDPCFLPLASGVHGFCLKGGFDSIEHVNSSLVSMYTRCKCFDSAYKFFQNLSFPDLVTWSALISGLAQVGKCMESLALFRKMNSFRKKADEILVVSLLSACSFMAAFKPCKELHGYIFKSGMSSDISVSCALIDSYIKCGFLEKGFSVFKLMPEKNSVTYNSLICGVGLHGLGPKAIYLFENMLQEGFIPDQATFSALLCACCHSGLLKEGWLYFRRMKDEFGIEAKIQHYVYMVKLLANDGRLKEAYDLIQAMSIPPDSGVLGALLFGCSLHGCSDLAEEVVQRIFEIEPRKTAYRIVLSNMYAAKDKWGDAKILRDDILEKGLRKIPGFSWIGVV
ncbi:Putative pentatricopeptide repeat-containing protein [Apostasia shenzhenica]|uniref:Pentatricopeptide repeat-containing protein n=1 Tax=Apostasia shenzhenica TaxID=1088818 RepID=A0A2I0AVV7_9ASPA|nr:Putative pentatricopeptide repeat-containing protein [Apostasia shenzhenica]